jgi:arginyl-tRNA synthetase
LQAVNPVDSLRGAVDAAAADLADGDARERAKPTLERPKQAAHGDYSTNAAMLLAPVLKDKPRAIAERLGAALAGRLGAHVDRVEVAGPGFLNVFLADAWYVAATAQILAAGDGWGGGGAEGGAKVNVEFVSANPTGPLTAAGGRHAAFGDALARILAFRGHDVHREYYVNDAGGQVLRLGASIRARARGEAVPEDGYQGSYVEGLAARIPGAADAGDAELAEQGVALLLEGIKASMTAFRVDFDTWFSESGLHRGPIEHAYRRLAEQGHTYEHEGALWLRTTTFGDDKDRVLRRSNGQHTYFAADIAYHLDKRERGWEVLIDLWGADHHGYIQRMKAAFAALGEDPERLELLIMQFVNVIERGERASMSKRRGDFVTLDELIADIGVDAARYFMLQRSNDTTLDLDLDLARQESNENPVFYVQYAHARIASMLRKAPDADVRAEASHALHPSERELIKKLLAFPDEVAEAAERRAPHRIATYALEAAQAFTAFYRDCRVLGAEEPGAEAFRLALSVAAQRTIAGALRLLGVTAPEQM